MKTSFFSFALAFFGCAFSTLFAQNQITGSLRDGDQKPLPFANALLFSAADSSLAQAVLTDEAGIFLFENLPSGDFLARFSMIGFEEKKAETCRIDGKKGQKNLGTFILIEKTASLGEVSVTARRPFLEQKIDRTVVNVANSITNAGGTALQVLQRSPGVQINALTKSISLAGKEGVVVMINGKIARLPADAVVDMLAGMTADQIDRIELIHTPPANFEAEGNAGIISIILKSTGDEGLNGGVSGKIGYGRAEKYGAGGYFNFRKKRANLFGSYDLDHNLNPQVFTNLRRVKIGNDVFETSSFSDRPHTPTTTQNARLGADFQISKKTVVGVLVSFFDRNWYMEAENAVKYSKNGQIDSLLKMPNSETNHNRSFAGNVNLSHQISKNQTLNVDADLVNYDISNPSDYQIEHQDAAGKPTAASELRISKKTPIRVAVAKADHALSFGKNARLETGAKFTSMRFENDVRVDQKADAAAVWQPISIYTSTSNLDEWVAAGYASFSSKMGEKVDFKAGLRYERTDTRLDSGATTVIVDRNYGSWFPSVFVGRKISETQNLNVSYARRITRPSIRRLAPWLIFSDPTTLEGGNPALQPSFTDAFSLSYGLKSYRLSVSYSIENDPMRFVPNVDKATNRQFNRHENLGVLKTWSANIYLPFKPTTWWEMSSNFYVNQSSLDFELEAKPLIINNLAGGFNVSNTITLPKKWTLEVTGEYDSPSYWGIAIWRATGSLNVGLEKNFGERWGKMRLNANDLFRSTNWFGTTDEPAIGLYVESSFQLAERVFMLSWSKNFGDRKLKSERKRQTGSAEEMRRI